MLTLIDAFLDAEEEPRQAAAGAGGPRCQPVEFGGGEGDVPEGVFQGKIGLEINSKGDDAIGPGDGGQAERVAVRDGAHDALRPDRSAVLSHRHGRRREPELDHRAPRRNAAGGELAAATCDSPGDGGNLLGEQAPVRQALAGEAGIGCGDGHPGRKKAAGGGFQTGEGGLLRRHPRIPAGSPASPGASTWRPPAPAPARRERPNREGPRLLLSAGRRDAPQAPRAWESGRCR